jgi:hypothetical protein
MSNKLAWVLSLETYGVLQKMNHEDNRRSAWYRPQLDLSIFPFFKPVVGKSGNVVILIA